MIFVCFVINCIFVLFVRYTHLLFWCYWLWGVNFYWIVSIKIRVFFILYYVIILFKVIRLYVRVNEGFVLIWFFVSYFLSLCVGEHKSEAERGCVCVCVDVAVTVNCWCIVMIVLNGFFYHYIINGVRLKRKCLPVRMNWLEKWANIDFCVPLFSGLMHFIRLSDMNNINICPTAISYITSAIQLWSQPIGNI